MSLAIDKEDPITSPSSTLRVTFRVKESFEEFVQLNPDLVVEQNANGEIVIMSPTGGDTADLNAELTFQLRAWSKQFGGTTFDSSIIFCLPTIRSVRRMRHGFRQNDGPPCRPKIGGSSRD